MATVEMRTSGRRGRSPSFDISFPNVVSGGRITLRELIALAVREELAAYAERRGERTFAQVLTDQRVEAGREAGRIDSGQRNTAPPPPPEVAVDVAIEAFEDGLFLVLVDGRQETDLDAQVIVGPDSSVTFVRLVALSGG